MSEVTRLRMLYSGVPFEQVYGGSSDDYGHDYSADISNVIGLYLEELSRRDAERAEREKPITEEWLESIGFRPSAPEGFGLRIFDIFDDNAGDDPHFQVLITEECRSVWLDCYDGSGDSIGLCEIGNGWTRGQLLDLLRALKGGVV